MSEDAGDEVHAINGWSIFMLVVFLLTNVVVIAPIRIPFPRSIWRTGHHVLVRCRILSPISTTAAAGPVYFSLDYSTAPLTAVLLLLATKSLGIQEVRFGIIGSDGVEPYNIMCLFVSLAYIAISLDATGLLRFLAFWVAKKGGNSGRRLYLYLYLFFLLYGILVGNDPVILSGTTFLAYLTRVTGMTPTAWIFGQFAACNMASAVLVSSNITNLVLSGAYSLSFVTYSANTILPFLASSVLVFPYLMFVTFRLSGSIPCAIHPPDVDPLTALADKRGAIFGSALLAITLVVLVSTSAAGLRVAVWEVTVPAALLMLARDLAHDLRVARTGGFCLGIGRCRKFMQEKASNSYARVGRADGTATADEPIQLSTPEGQLPVVIASSLPLSAGAGSALGAPPQSLASFISCLSHNIPTVTSITSRLPLPLLPFAFSMFTLVQGIGATGWLIVFTGWWATWAEKTGAIGVVFGMGLISVILCNLCGTNIGATILLARVLQLWNTQHSPPSRLSHGALYALALGSNYGAFSTTLPASLAGLLWRGILRQKGIEITTLQFCRLNAGTIAVAMAAGCAVLVGQLYIVY